jgi:hypothetical protein
VKSEGRIEAVDHAGDVFESAGERHREAGRGFAVPCIGFGRVVKLVEMPTAGISDGQVTGLSGLIK